MRIAVDVRDLKIATTGSKTFLEELCTVFPAVTTEDEFILLSPKFMPPKGDTPLHKALNHLYFYWWKEVSLPWLAWRENCQIIFCTDYVVPLLSSCPTVPVFYDASFWELPENYNRSWRFLLDLLALPAARKSPIVVTISETSCQSLAKYVRIPLEKLVIVHMAPKKLARTILPLEERQKILIRYGLSTSTKFILHVGVIDKRKNLPRLVEAFSLAIPHLGEDYRLVLVGKPSSKKNSDDYKNVLDMVSDRNLEDKVIFTNYVPDEDLPAFYQSARLFAFPSLYEGFGIPALEAFANGLPVIATDATSVPEVVGDAAILFNPYESEEIAEAIIKVASNGPLHVELVRKGYEQLQKFSWEKTARQLVDAFRNVNNQH